MENGNRRAVVDAFIEQTGVDLGRRLVGEAWRMQQVQHDLLLRGGQRPDWPRSQAGDRRRRGQPRAPALHTGARNPERGTGRFGDAAGWHECHDSVRQGSLSLGANGLGSVVFGPRLAGIRPPMAPPSRWRRQSVRFEE